jgi:hypothetical protein
VRQGHIAAQKGGPETAFFVHLVLRDQASDFANVARLKLAILACRDVELDTRVIVKGLEALGLDLGIMNEQIIPVLA